MFEETPKTKKTICMMLLFLPLVIAVVWLVYLKITTEAVGIGAGTFLSPLDNTPLITGLVIFTLGYLFFIGMMFSSNIRDMISDFKRRREL